MRRLLHVLPAAVFGALVLTMLALLTDDERNANMERLPSPLVGGPVPAFSLPPIPGAAAEGVSTDMLGGRVSAVNVFASWCGPCVVEHPSVARLAREGFAVYGINYRDRAPDALAWLERHGNPYAAVGFDPDARASFEWGVTGVPETFLVDAEGRIVHKHVGPIMPADLDGKILPMLRALR